jgi:hypothetical protein
VLLYFLYKGDYEEGSSFNLGMLSPTVTSSQMMIRCDLIQKTVAARKCSKLHKRTQFRTIQEESKLNDSNGREETAIKSSFERLRKHRSV